MVERSTASEPSYINHSGMPLASAGDIRRPRPRVTSGFHAPVDRPQIINTSVIAVATDNEFMIPKWGEAGMSDDNAGTERSVPGMYSHADAAHNRATHSGIHGDVQEQVSDYPQARVDKLDVPAVEAGEFSVPVSRAAQSFPHEPAMVEDRRSGISGQFITDNDASVEAMTTQNTQSENTSTAKNISETNGNAIDGRPSQPVTTVSVDKTHFRQWAGFSPTPVVQVKNLMQHAAGSPALPATDEHIKIQNQSTAGDNVYTGQSFDAQPLTPPSRVNGVQQFDRSPGFTAGKVQDNAGIRAESAEAMYPSHVAKPLPRGLDTQGDDVVAKSLSTVQALKPKFIRSESSSTAPVRRLEIKRLQVTVKAPATPARPKAPEPKQRPAAATRGRVQPGSAWDNYYYAWD